MTKPHHKYGQTEEYKGDDPAIRDALDRVKPITLEQADWSGADDRYGVIDGFIAVIDGRDDLDSALELAREIIQIAEYEVVTVIRQSSSLAKTEDKISQLFYDATFGRQAVAVPGKKVGSGPARQGTVMLDAEHNNFYIKTPSSAFSSVNLLRGILGRDVPAFDYKKTGLLSGGLNLGKDVETVFGAAGRAFPEYMSVYMSHGASTSEPGVMHFDSGYVAKEDPVTGAEVIGRHNIDLPHKFIEAAQKRDFEPLPGGVTITSSVVGGGSIVRKTDLKRYQAYKEQERNNELSQNKEYFQDGEGIGYQGQDGDVMIMRNDRWPDDEHGKPRLPSDHCSTLINAYGNDGNHLGRIVGLMSTQVCYLSPHIQEQQAEFNAA